MVKKNILSKLSSQLSYLSLCLAILALGTIACFYFPEYLTTPDIRRALPIPLIRQLLHMVLVLTSILSVGLLLAREKMTRATISLSLVVLALLLGGAQVPLKEEFQDFVVQLGLDWLLLDVFLLAIIFVPLEALFPRHDQQKIIRPEFKTDLTYFAVGHLGIQFIMLLTQKPVHVWMQSLAFLPNFWQIDQLPLWLQIPLTLFIADLTQYFLHRGFHKSKRLWQFHKVHHSIKHLDWLAGSRLHLVDIVVVRTLVYFAVLLLGPSTYAFNGYVLFMAMQTVLAHANIRFEFGLIKYVLVTPKFHHWHHHDQPLAYDKNFAVHFPVIDMIFGTYYLPKEWPDVYGVNETDYPKGYWGQFFRPFKKY